MTPSGQTVLAVGLYDPNTGVRLAIDSNSELLDHAILPGPTIAH
mgnify:CR=1 FL=1